MLLKPQQDFCINEDCRFWALFSKNLFSPPHCRRAERSVTELALLQKAAKGNSHHFLMHQISFGHTGPPQFIKILKRDIKTVHCAWIWKFTWYLGFVLASSGTLQHSQPWWPLLPASCALKVVRGAAERSLLQGPFIYLNIETKSQIQSSTAYLYGLHFIEPYFTNSSWFHIGH